MEPSSQYPSTVSQQTSIANDKHLGVMKGDQISMQGGGYYNANSSLQGLAIDKASKLFEPPVFLDSCITIADYGSSEGQNPIRLIATFLKGLPSISSATLVFIDTPFNDFSSLSSTINANWDLLSCGKEVEIHPLMAPRSYFQKVLPDGFIDAGFCFTALHWLQHMPCGVQGEGMPNPSVMAASAHTDLVMFLSHRHKEIRPGGLLTLCIPINGPIGVAPALRCLEATIRSLSGRYSLRPSLSARLPLYFRTMEEILAAVNAPEGRWRVTGSAVVPVDHPAWSLAIIEANQTDGDRAAACEEYASGVAGFTMAALSRFLVDEAKYQAQKLGQDGLASTSDDPGEEAFLKVFSASFKAEFLRSNVDERVGFTYAFLRLERL